jgi:hypothetical protein
MKGADAKFAWQLEIERPRKKRFVILDAGVRNKSQAAESKPDARQYRQTPVTTFGMGSPGRYGSDAGGLCHWEEPGFGAAIGRKLRKGVRILYTQQIQYTVIVAPRPEMSHPSSGLRVKGKGFVGMADM